MWYCNNSQRSSTINCGAPVSRFSRNRWLILNTSTSLCVKSSSERSPLSRVIDGRTVIGGTGRTLRTIHSGRFFLSIPMKIKSSEGMALSHSRTSRGLSLRSISAFPAPCDSNFSLKVVGLSSIILPCIAWQCIHCPRRVPVVTFSTSLMILANSVEPTPCLIWISRIRVR